MLMGGLSRPAEAGRVRNAPRPMDHEGRVAAAHLWAQSLGPRSVRQGGSVDGAAPLHSATIGRCHRQPAGGQTTRSPRPAAGAGWERGRTRIAHYRPETEFAICRLSHPVPCSGVYDIYSKLSYMVSYGVIYSKKYGSAIWLGHPSALLPRSR